MVSRCNGIFGETYNKETYHSIQGFLETLKVKEQTKENLMIHYCVQYTYTFFVIFWYEVYYASREEHSIEWYKFWRKCCPRIIKRTTSTQTSNSGDCVCSVNNVYTVS